MQLDFNAVKIKDLFREVGLYNPKNNFYTEKVRKHKQIFAYIEQLQSTLNKLSTKRPIVMVDCGCGKSYLSFVLYEYCTSILNRKIKIIGIDNNAELVSKCQATAKELHFDHMHFYSEDVQKFTTTESVDIVYSLHACDTATDQTIAKGIELNAKYIFSVSCCQHTNRKKISKHPLTSVSRHKPYKERLVDMIGDSMRGLLMESLGYGVKIFEFVAAEQTPKNIMVRGVKNNVKKSDQEAAISNYKHLVKMFNFAPALEQMLRVFFYS